MSCTRITANNILPKRKYFLHAGSCLLIIFLLTTEIVCRPQEQDEENFKEVDDYPDADNIEWHHVKLVDGGFQEDHPIIMYKEDFVNEDYDPNQKISSTELKGTDSSKKYKELAKHMHKKNENKTKTEKYQVVEPEKIYFDILPQSPVVVLDSAEKDSKFDASKIHAELISLVDDEKNSEASYSEDIEDTNEENSKDSLRKKPKKYHHRVRRQAADDDHKVQKRNPYYRLYPYQNINNLLLPQILPSPYYYPQPVYQKNPVAGHREPTVVVGSRFDDGIYFPTDDYDNIDKFAFAPAPARTPIRTPAQRPIQRPTQRPTQRPALQPAMRPSQMFPQRPNQIDDEPRTTTGRPILNLIHDSNPENADFSGFNPSAAEPSLSSQRAESFQTEIRNRAGDAPISFPVDINKSQITKECMMATNYCCILNSFKAVEECFAMQSCPQTRLEVFFLANNKI